MKTTAGKSSQLAFNSAAPSRSLKVYFEATSLNFQDLRVELRVPRQFFPRFLSMSEPAAAPSAPNPTFEQALQELEALVARMEDGKLPLEESLAAYQRGAELIKFCESRLADAQARIAILDGGELRDFTPDSR